MRDDIDDQPELTAISSFVFQRYEHQWEDVARYVREGCTDPQFLFVLQRMLEPGTFVHGLRFGLKRSRSRPSTKVQIEDIQVLIRLLRDRARAERALQLIASEIRENGLSDELLRENLADMFSRVSDGPLGMKFEVDRRGKSAPHSKRKLEIENFLELHADIFGESTKRTIEAASVIFGVQEDTADKYLQRRRGVRRCDEFWSIEAERDVANRMRELGYPEYQPLADILRKRDLNPLPGRK